jgi:hypothetical protein
MSHLDYLLYLVPKMDGEDRVQYQQGQVQKELNLTPLFSTLPSWLTSTAYLTLGLVHTLLHGLRWHSTLLWLRPCLVSISVSS